MPTEETEKWGDPGGQYKGAVKQKIARRYSWLLTLSLAPTDWMHCENRRAFVGCSGSRASIP
jgi:hypothetical protein